MCSGSSPVRGASLGDTLSGADGGSPIIPGVISAEEFVRRVRNADHASSTALAKERDQLHVTHGKNVRRRVAELSGVKKMVETIGAGMSQAEAIEMIEAYVDQAAARIEMEVESRMKANLDMISRDKVRESLQEIERMMRGDRKIEAIKEARSITGLGLKEAKDWVEAMYKTSDRPSDLHPIPVHPLSGKETYIVLKKAENSYGTEVWELRGEYKNRNGFGVSARDQAQKFAKDYVENGDEIKVVIVVGETKPVFQMVG